VIDCSRASFARSACCRAVRSLRQQSKIYSAPWIVIGKFNRYVLLCKIIYACLRN